MCLSVVFRRMEPLITLLTKCRLFVGTVIIIIIVLVPSPMCDSEMLYSLQFLRTLVRWQRNPAAVIRKSARDIPNGNKARQFGHYFANKSRLIALINLVSSRWSPGLKWQPTPSVNIRCSSVVAVSHRAPYQREFNRPPERCFIRNQTVARASD